MQMRRGLRQLFKTDSNISHTFVPCLLLILLLCSCSNTKYIAGDELYTGARFKFVNNSEKNLEKGALSSMQQVLLPKPNKKLLGARIKLAIYNRVRDSKKKSGLRYWLKYKLGEPPVLLSQIDPHRTTLLLENRLNTYGHFRSSATYDVAHNKKKASITYNINVAPPYIIDSVFFPEVTSRLTHKMVLTKDSSLLRIGDHYNLQVIIAERQRIDHMLKIEGYFYFSPDFIIIRADTSLADHHCKLYVALKENIPEESLKFYYIGDIYLFPEFSLDQQQVSTLKADTLIIDSINYVTTEHKFKPRTIVKSVYFQKGGIYDVRYADLTISRLMGLGVFKFGNIKFQPDSLHDGWLTTKIFLTPFPKKSLRAEMQGITKDNGFTGPGVNFSIRNRNSFRGAELFVLNLSGNYEVQIFTKLPPLSALKVGITPQLIFPRFIVPFKMARTASLFVPKTKIEFNYSLENRQGYYNLYSFYVNYGYIWKETITKEHSFTPISINYLDVSNTTPAFDSILLLNPALAESYQRQFVLAINYSFTYTNQVLPWKRNPIYFRGTIELSGNTAYALQTLLEKRKGTPELPFTILNNAYSQYAWTLLDFRYYLKTGKEARIATRLNAGLGLPYGNSDVLPYYKSFSAGGVSDLRGFRTRSLGPGSFYDRKLDSLGIYNQVGDVKIESNIEFRFPIYGYLKGALFADVGNIWMHSTKLYGEEGVFRLNRFYKELAVDAGLGFRFDITYVVIRLDLGTPLRKPYITENGGWRFDPFSKNEFGRTDLILNLGIGYPF